MRHIDCKIATDLNLFYRNLPEEMGHSVNYVIASIPVWALEPFTDPWLIVERTFNPNKAGDRDNHSVSPSERKNESRPESQSSLNSPDAGKGLPCF